MFRRSVSFWCDWPLFTAFYRCDWNWTSDVCSSDLYFSSKNFRLRLITIASCLAPMRLIPSIDFRLRLIEITSFINLFRCDETLFIWMCWCDGSDAINHFLPELKHVWVIVYMPIRSGTQSQSQHVFVCFDILILRCDQSLFTETQICMNFSLYPHRFQNIIAIATFMRCSDAPL